MNKIYALKVLKYLSIFNLGVISVKQFQCSVNVSWMIWVSTIVILLSSRRLISKEFLKLNHETWQKIKDK
jgi:hypothetical protein